MNARHYCRHCKAICPAHADAFYFLSRHDRPDGRRCLASKRALDAALARQARWLATHTPDEFVTIRHYPRRLTPVAA